jgi:hypothetical protein
MTNQEYRRLYKGLRAFFDFSFKLPYYTKEFTPQQKAAITRKFSRVSPYIDDNFKVKTDEVTFLKYPKRSRLPGVDGVRTNKGIIYKWPKAQVKKSKVEKNQWRVIVRPKVRKGAMLMEKRVDIFIPFPKKILHDIKAIELFVRQIKEKYAPVGIQWGYEGSRHRHVFDIQKLELYISTDDMEFNFGGMREVVDAATKKYKNLLSPDKETREKANARFMNSDLYAFLDDLQRRDFWAGLNYYRSARRDDFTYNGIFLVYYL